MKLNSTAVLDSGGHPPATLNLPNEHNISYLFNIQYLPIFSPGVKM